MEGAIEDCGQVAYFLRIGSDPIGRVRAALSGSLVSMQ
jgi:hypothetical protein